MTFEQLKKKILNDCRRQLEDITAQCMLEAEGIEEGENFEFTVGDKTYNINVKSEYNEEKVEYTKEEYKILKVVREY